MRFHALVSRFNWPHPVWSERSSADYEIWLESRFELLERFTIPSLRNCYQKPSVWIILVSDVATDLLNRLERSAQIAGIPVHLQRYTGKSIDQSIRDAVSNYATEGEIWTTRLDTDDLVSADIFARLRSTNAPELRERGAIAFSFPGGCNFDLLDNNFYYSSFAENPFLTLAEEVDRLQDLKTVMFKSHVELPACVGRFICLRSFQPMWASVIHDLNIGNQSLRKTNKSQIIPNKLLRQRFGIGEVI